MQNSYYYYSVSEQQLMTFAIRHMGFEAVIDHKEVLVVINVV
jgi:hypothetical protein